RALFVQAARVVLIRSKNWERYGLKPWIEKPPSGELPRRYLLAGVVDEAGQLPQEGPQLPTLGLRLCRIAARPICPIPLAPRPTTLAAMLPADWLTSHGWCSAGQLGSAASSPAACRGLPWIQSCSYGRCRQPCYILASNSPASRISSRERL